MFIIRSASRDSLDECRNDRQTGMFQLFDGSALDDEGVTVLHTKDTTLNNNDVVAAQPDELALIMQKEIDLNTATRNALRGGIRRTRVDFTNKRLRRDPI